MKVSKSKVFLIVLMFILVIFMTACNKNEIDNLNVADASSHMKEEVDEAVKTSPLERNTQTAIIQVDKLEFDGNGIDFLYDPKSVSEITIRNVKDFNFLLEMENLKKIVVEEGYATTVSGNVAVIGNCKRLEYIDLGGTILSGDISSFSDLSELRHLNLHSGSYFDDELEGDISSFVELTKLEFLDIGETHITGEIVSISNLTNLKYLDISNSRLSELSGIENLVNLKHIKIFFSDIRGDIESFRHLEKLESLEVEFNYNLTGDLEALKGLKNLKILNLAETEVTGNIEALREMKFLAELRLNYNYNISGNIEVLSNLENLKIICLQMTPITGDISTFSKLINLEVLKIHDTEIYGNIETLNELQNLTDLIYEGTNTTGTYNKDNN